MNKKIIALFLVLVLSLSFLSAKIDCTYAYGHLTKKEQVVYDKIKSAVHKNEAMVNDVLPTADENMKVLLAFVDDNPDVFWVESGFTFYKESKDKFSMKLKLTHQDNLEFDKQRFYEQVTLFHNFVKDDPNDWIKLYHIYDFLAKNIKYDNNYMDQSMWSVFFDGIGVCAGFARSFQYLALQENIPCIMVRGFDVDQQGKQNKVGHGWVMAYLDGNWYQFDPTWGIVDANGNVDFTYFCRSDAKMGRTHIIDSNYPLPPCPTDELSYINMRERYLSKYSYAAGAKIVKEALKRGEYTFTMEFSGTKEFAAAKKDLFDNGAIHKMIRESGYTAKNILYSDNPVNYTIKISLRK